MIVLINIIMIVSLALIILRWPISLLLKFYTKSPVAKDYSFEPTVSVLIAVFNEGPAIYETIESMCKCEYPRDKFEIIAVDDCSNDNGVTWEWMQKAQRDFPNIKLGRNTVNSKKPQTIINALGMSTGEIIIYVDSDCVFSPNCIRELVACLADETVGAVGGQIGVRNPNASVYTKFQTLIYYLSFILFKAYENQLGTVTCISGGLFATKRNVLERTIPYVQNRKFLGVHVVMGEDRFLTSTIRYEFGLRTLCNLDAKCLTNVPTTWNGYLKQQRRWRAGTLLDFFTTLFRLPQSVMKIGPGPTIAMLIPGGSSLLYSAVCLTAPFFNPTFFLTLAPFAWYLGLSMVLILLIRRYAPEQRLENPFKLVIFGVWWIVSNVFITALAITSLDSSEWGTR